MEKSSIHVPDHQPAIVIEFLNTLLYSSAQKFYSRKHVARHGWNLPKPSPCSPQAKLTDHRSYHWAWEISNFDSSELAIISCTTMLVAHVPWSKHCTHIYTYTHTHLYTVYNGNPSQIGNHSTYRYQHVGWDPSPDDPQIPHKRSEIGHSWTLASASSMYP